MFWPFTVWINYSSDLKMFTNSLPSALNFSFSRSLEQFFLTVGQNNFRNKIPYLHFCWGLWTTSVVSEGSFPWVKSFWKSKEFIQRSQFWSRLKYSTQTCFHAIQLKISCICIFSNVTLSRNWSKPNLIKASISWLNQFAN